MKLNSKVFRKAAEIHNCTFACFSIAEAQGFKDFRRSLYTKILEIYFKHSEEEAFFSYTENGDHDPEFDAHEELGSLRRQLALLLMAEMIESGDL